MKDLHSYKSALRISIIYLIVGILWIYFSDNLVEFLSSGNIHELTLFQNYKGWFFIIVTAILLLLLNYHYFHKHHIEYMQHINEQKMAHLQLTQKDALLQTIINSSPDAIFVKDLEGKYILFNIGAGILTGVTPEEVIGNGDSVIFSPEIADQLRIMDRSIALNGKIVNHDEYLITASGMEKYFWITKGPVFTKEGDLFGIFGISRDITERKKIEIALQESESFLNQSQRNAGIGSYSLDMKTMLWKSSDTLDEIFGIDHHYEHSLNGWLNLIHPDDRESMSIYFQEYVVDNHQRFDREYRIVRQNDHAIRWVNGLGKLEFDEMNTPVKMVGTIQDVTETKEHEDQLKYMAHYDPLTGLPNRVLKSDRLRHAMTLSQRRGHIAVLYLDLDGFKEVNERYGHSVGDKLLIALSSRMKNALREGDTLSRLGGDEFVAILVDLEEISASLPIIQRLLDSTSQTIDIDDIAVQISASIGVSFYPQNDDVDADQLIRQADQAMYEAKQAGKNRYHVFDSENDRTIRVRHENIDRIRQALENNEFVLYYQPKINMQTGEFIGAEALIRWQHPTEGIIPPLKFLPIIENHPLAVEVGEWVINETITQIKRWQAQGLNLPISVNIGARQLLQGDFVERLRIILAQHENFDFSLLEIEILETSALEDVNLASNIIEVCKTMGINFSLDDFGTGYSSLTYLKQLPVTTLKIDQSFVRNMLDDHNDLAILEGIIGLASAFSREVIAEGVESHEHGNQLLLLGCYLAQGYGIARPMPADKIIEWAHDWEESHTWIA